jgi:hypothetical protein
MRNVAISLGFATVGVALALLYLSKPADGATGLLLTIGLFTIVIAAVVRE